MHQVVSSNLTKVVYYLSLKGKKPSKHNKEVFHRMSTQHSFSDDSYQFFVSLSEGYIPDSHKPLFNIWFFYAIKHCVGPQKAPLFYFRGGQSTLQSRSYIKKHLGWWSNLSTFSAPEPLPPETLREQPAQ